MKITVLGCGAAGGLPMISIGWGDCDPANPRNRRSRASILVEEGDTRILVDTSPDLRAQLLAADIRALDAVLYTHDHADHLHGIDDLREINRAMGKPLNIHAEAALLERIRSRFSYVFGEVTDSDSIYKPMLLPQALNGPQQIGPIKVTHFEQDHGWTKSTGFRFGDAAYSTDLVDLPEEAFEILTGVKLWIVGCLQYKPHPTHAHVDKVLGWAERIKPERVVLTHMGPRLDYERLKSELPDGIEPAYDGMVLTL